MPRCELLPCCRSKTAAVYARHRPETTLLYQVVQEYWPEFQADLASQGKYLPAYVTREFEREALQAVLAYEEVLARKSGKRTRASRTWQMIERHGILAAVERAVNRASETQGYTALVEMGLEEFAFEAVILRHPDLFSKEAVLRSRTRLQAWKTADEPDTKSDSHNPEFTIIQDAGRIARAQSVFEGQVGKATSKSGLIALGYQGGGSEEMAYHVAEFDFWVAIADSDNRYWNALGLGDPFENNHTIITEINPPKAGIGRNIAGAFVEDTNGEIWLARRGKIGGGRKDIGKEAFLDWYTEPLDLVYDGDRHTPMLVVGALGEEGLMANLARFTRRVGESKDEAVSGLLRGE